MKSNLHFVSVEGNWDRSIHDKRIEHAAKILNENKSSLVIASGTYAPSPYLSFFRGQLGEYTKEILVNKYNISAMRIFPAYLFPYKSSYTIIDAFTNAVLIGWVSCGLKKRNDKICVLFEPSTSAFHGLRVETLNKRACKYLYDLGVTIEVVCSNKLLYETLKEEFQGEISRISEMKSKGALIDSGTWFDNGRKRSYDDLFSMKNDLALALKPFFNFTLSHIDTCLLSESERLVFTLSWNKLANTNVLLNKDIEDICLYVESNFNIDISDDEIFSVKKIINELRD